MSKIWKNPKSKSPSTLLLTPLIDIIFLITIFFVLTTSFSLNPSFDVDLPEALTGESTLEDQFVLTLSPPTRVFLGDQETTLQGLGALIYERVEDWPIEKKRSQKILIRGDQSLAYGFIMSVLDILRQNNLTNISLVTERLEG